MKSKGLQAFSLCLFLIGATIAVAVLARAEQATEKASLIKQVEAMPAYPLKVVGNEQCPLRIAEAQVKEVPASLFTQLTGTTTDLTLVASVPHVKLVNVSNKTVKSFVFDVWSPAKKESIGFCSLNPIKPGGEVTLSTNHFAGREKVFVATSNGVKAEYRAYGWDSPKKWITFASRDQLEAGVSGVKLEDDSMWTIPQEGGR